MSSDGQKRLLKDISNEIERHKNLYKLVEFKSVVARRDVPGREGKWHNFITLVKMLHSGTLKPWKKQVEKENFAILQAVVTLDRFKEVLKRLVNEEVLEINGYQAFGPFNFGQMEFLSSERSQRLYNTNCGVNFWRVTGKENFGLPSGRTLKLESDIIPFERARDAIEYHTGLTHEGFERIQNSVHIVAPLYYGRIVEVVLSGLGLLVEIDCKIANLQDIQIKYNTEGPDKGTIYSRTLEADTVQPDKNTTTIHLKQYAKMATVWLHHTKGFVIDSQRTRRTSSIETIVSQLSLESQYLSEEDAQAITETITLHSKENIPALVTTEQCVDSIDVEILKAVKNLGGEYTKFLPEVLKYLSIDMLLSRLARLRTLGFLKLQPPKKILLTSLGVDALNLPPGVLSAKVPPEVGGRLAEIRLAFRDENYDEVSNKSTKLIEAILRKRLEEKFSGTFQDVWPNLNLGPYKRASLGTLKEACSKLKVFKKNGLADHILSTILKLRVPMSHEKEGITSPANIASLTVHLIEAFVREWYYLELLGFGPT